MPTLIAVILALLPALQEREPPRPAGPGQGRAREARERGQAPQAPRRKDGKAPAAQPEPPEPKGPPPAEVLREEAARRELVESLASERLREIEDTLGAAWLARRPSLARRRGLPPRDVAAVRLGFAARREWQSAVARAGDELETVDWSDLSALRRADHARLRAFVAAEIAESHLVPVERWSPSHYLREINALLAGAARAPELAPDARLANATARVAELPDVLASARADLTPPARAAQHALRHMDELDALLGDEITGRLAAARPSHELWRPFQEALATARAAAAETRAWLAEAARGRGHLPAVGADAWRRMATSATGAAVDVPALKVKLMRDAAEIGVSLGPGWDPGAPPDLTPQAVAVGARAALAAGWKVAALLGLAEGDPPPVAVEAELDLGPPGAPFELGWDVAGKKERARLAVIVDGAAWTAAERERRASDLTQPALRAGALRHGYPGELLWETWSRASELPSHRALWNDAMRAGWGLYAADVATRLRPAENPLAQDAALRREVARARRLEAVRLYASLRVHADGAEEGEVAREVAGLTGLAPETAASEVLEARLDPLRGAGYLAYLELVRVERELGAALPAGVDAAALVGRAVRRSPSCPPALLPAPEIPPMPAEAAPEGSAAPPEPNDRGEPGEPADAGDPADPDVPGASTTEREDSLNAEDPGTR